MQANLIKSKETYDPSKVTDDVLHDDHKQTHVWWATIRGGSKVEGWSQEDVYNAHKLIVKEMRGRGIKHTTPLLLSNAMQYDQPIRASERDGEAKGPMLFLPSVMKAFSGDFMISEDFVTVVGGLCNHGKTRGDIDILLKCKEPREESSPLGMATKFRIARALAKQNIMENRIEFLYNDFSGPFTSHVHVFDLVLRRKAKRELHQMAASGVRPFSFVVQPKPIMGRFKEEIFSPETVVEVIKDLRGWGEEAVKAGVIVEQKFDGFRVQVHKKGDKVKILTEENTDVTNKLPSLVAALQSTKRDFIVEGEVELWQDGKHQNRADASSVITSKEVPPREKDLKITFYDLMWMDGKDLHTLPFIERIPSLMNVIPDNPKLNVSRIKEVKTMDALKAAVIEASKKPGSEGAMIKKKDYVYPLKPHTSDMIKFKNEFSIKVEVVDALKVKGTTDTFSYIVALKDDGELAPAGKTFNTNIKASKGEALEVVFVEISQNVDPKSKKLHFNMFAPRVVGKAGNADSVDTAKKLVSKSGGQVQSRPFPTRFKGLLAEDEYIDNFYSMVLTEETEEFELALSRDWINADTIPDRLVKTNNSEIRNNDSFIVKKDFENRSVICLRNKENKIKAEKLVHLVEV